MADDTAGNISQVSQQGNIQGLIALMNALYPAGGYNSSQTSGPQTVTTSDKTQTTEEVASPEAVQQLIQQMLQGTSGLASVAQGEKGAGMYNSTTNQQLMNDLMSRVASAGAALNKKTVQTISGGTTTTSGQTTTANKTMTPQLTPADLAKLVGGGALAASAAKAASDLLKPGPQGQGGSAQGSKRKPKDDSDPTGPENGTSQSPDYSNTNVYDQNFVQAIDPSMRNNPGDQIQFAAQGDSMLMTPVNDYNALLNQSLNMGGLLNENNVNSLDQPTDNSSGGFIDLTGNSMFGPDPTSAMADGAFSNTGMGNSYSPPPMKDYGSWNEYMQDTGNNPGAGTRFSMYGGQEQYIVSPSNEVLNYDDRFESSLNDKSDFTNPNFDWGSFDWSDGFNSDSGGWDTYTEQTVLE